MASLAYKGWVMYHVYLFAFLFHNSFIITSSIMLYCYSLHTDMHMIMDMIHKHNIALMFICMNLNFFSSKILGHV